MATLPLVIAMALAVLVQAYLAGAAAAVDADFWALHKTWIAIFQWLSVLLAIATSFGQRDLLTRLLSLAPMIIIAIQYTSIHLALRQSIAWLAGVHAANAPLLFGALVRLAVRCRRSA
jgi:Family of unknown function (DUF6220)